VLGCAVLAVLIVLWRRPGLLPARAVWWWIGSAVLFGAGLGLFDTLVYGGALRSGYRPGEIRFSLAAILPNLRLMPSHLIEAMPMLVLGLVALIWIAVRMNACRRDAAVGLALGACWLSVWGLYAAYAWTALPGLSTLQSVRFYLPAIGPIALLGAWALTRLTPRKGLAVATSAAVAATFGFGIWSFSDTTTFRLMPKPAHGPPPGRHGPGSPSGASQAPR
jgi:hypothetical protein